jgi:hypothetical protein
MNTKILIIVIVIVILGIGGFFAYQNLTQSGQPGETGETQTQGPQATKEENQGPSGTEGEFGQKPGEKQEKSSGKPITVPEPPAGKVSVYKGFWMPAGFYPDYQGQSMSGSEVLKGAGANIASIAVTPEINAKGEVRFEVPSDYIEQSLAYWAEQYYAAGIRLSLTLEPRYEEVFVQGGGEPQPIPSNLANDPRFLDNYNKIAVEMAKLAEKYHVEIFSPMNEPDLKLGEARANQWAQEILPIVRTNYSGKILWKAAGGALDKYDTNFKGYDIIGFDPSPGGGPFEQSMTTFRQALKNLLSIAQSRATRDNVSEIMVTEFGCWGGAVNFTEEQKVLAHRAVFEEAQGKVSGFFALDPPPDLDRGLAGTQTLEEIKTWFKEKLQ